MDENFNNVRDGELVGIYETSNGRSCKRYECCGKTLERDAVIRFLLRMVPTGEDGSLEEALAAIKISDGIEECTVGFFHEDWSSLRRMIMPTNAHRSLICTKTWKTWC